MTRAGPWLDVAETTIRRWADEEVIPYVKTPGGHRKFRLSDILRFAEGRGHVVASSPPPTMTSEQMELLQPGGQSKDYPRIAGVFTEEVLQADCTGILTLLKYLYKNGIPSP